MLSLTRFLSRGPRPFEEGAAFFPGGKLMMSLTEAKATF